MFPLSHTQRISAKWRIEYIEMNIYFRNIIIILSSFGVNYVFENALAAYALCAFSLDMNPTLAWPAKCEALTCEFTVMWLVRPSVCVRGCV